MSLGLHRVPDTHKTSDVTVETIIVVLELQHKPMIQIIIGTTARAAVLIKL